MKLLIIFGFVQMQPNDPRVAVDQGLCSNATFYFDFGQVQSGWHRSDTDVSHDCRIQKEVAQRESTDLDPEGPHYEMNVNATLIKHKRENNAWSQQQLAEISGLSLRTVQRLESTGRGSLDSVKAIASAFELTPADVIQGNKESKFLSPFGKVIATFIASCLIASLACLYIVFGVNQLVTLEVSIGTGSSQELVNILEDELGAEMKVKYDEHSYFVFTPKPADEGKLSISIAAFSTNKGSSPEKIGNQTLVVEQHKNTTTIFETHPGKSYTFDIKASIGEPN